MLFGKCSLMLILSVLFNSLQAASIPAMQGNDEQQDEQQKCGRVVDSPSSIVPNGDASCVYDIIPPQNTNFVLRSRGRPALSCRKLRHLIQLFDVETGEKQSICTDDMPGVYFRATSSHKYKLLMKPTGYEINYKFAFEKNTFTCNEEIPIEALGHRLRLKFDENAGIKCTVIVPGNTVVELFPRNKEFLQKNPMFFEVIPNLDELSGPTATRTAFGILRGGEDYQGVVPCDAGALRLTRLIDHPAPGPIDFIVREPSDEEVLVSSSAGIKCF